MDSSIVQYDDMDNPVTSGEAMIAKLEEATDLLMSVVKELKHLGVGSDDQETRG